MDSTGIQSAQASDLFLQAGASQLGSATIECEHLLLGLVHARQDLATARPARFAPPIAELRSAVASRANVMPAVPHTVMIPFSDATKVVLARAAETAASLGHQQISTGHLLMGLVRSEPSLAADILAQHQMSERSLPSQTQRMGQGLLRYHLLARQYHVGSSTEDEPRRRDRAK